MDIFIDLALDADGFLPRQCPNCNAAFKMHYGPANAEAESQPAASRYFCPLCGTSAALEELLTPTQAAQVNAATGAAALQAVEQELKNMFRGAGGMKGSFDMPEQPPALLADSGVEEMILTSPCHEFEPFKVPTGGSAFHCVMCGSRFGV